MQGFDKEGIYFLPLGGAEEVGFNLYVYAVNGKLIVVDCGFGFLNDDFPGMDMGMADSSFLDNYVDEIEALFITHAHEDHFGAIAHLLPKLKCPVYATEFTLKHIRRRLDERKVHYDDNRLIEVADNGVVKLPDFEVKFAYMVHTTPQNACLLIKSKYGNVVHATDWRLDDEALAELGKTNFTALEEFGRLGVDLLVGDSTNLATEKVQLTEMDIRKSLINLVPQFKNTLVATCFASNVMRLESLLIAADKAGRTPVISGMSLIQNAKIAKECGYLQNAPKFLEAREATDIPLDKVLYICAGSQGNYKSGLYRIVNEENKNVSLGNGDAIIFSSEIIPGNEDKIEAMQEKLRLRGVEVISKEEYTVHTTGHGGKAEIKIMYDLLKPRVVLPVHGDKRYLREHARFAKSLGVEQVVNALNGDVMLYHQGKIERVEQVSTDIIGIDRKQLTSLNSQLVKNRRRLMYNCSLFVSVVFASDWTLEDLQISSIDIIDESDFNVLVEEIKAKMLVEIPVHVELLKHKEAAIIDYIKSRIRKYVFNQTDIKPVMFMHFYKKEEK
ncbi:MAG: ribonuclease J [Alphaproteobacteria bacterium]|nr:ribonuclease J [Alphaproteobacteria bacterium]